MLLGCILIDATDILSAHLGGLDQLFNETDTWSLKLTAIAALVPEGIALLLHFITAKKHIIKTVNYKI